MEYINAQIWIICLMAFAFGPFMPMMFIYGALGILIQYVTMRLRIAYSVRRVPKYNVLGFTRPLSSIPVLIFSFTASSLYQNPSVFGNEVFTNKTHYLYFAFQGNLSMIGKLFEYETITPGLIFSVICLLFLCRFLYYLLVFIFPSLRFCSREKTKLR